MEEDENGNLYKTNRHLSNIPDVHDIAVQEYHKNVSKLASEQISKQDLKDRDFNAFAMNINKDKLPKAKQMVQDFVKKFISEIEAEATEGEETYQLNVQFFGLSKSCNNSKNNN